MSNIFFHSLRVTGSDSAAEPVFDRPPLASLRLGIRDGRWEWMLPLGNEFKEREIIFKFWPQMNAKYANSGKLTGLFIQLVAEFTQSKFHP
jgi:hypothetical protein